MAVTGQNDALHHVVAQGITVVINHQVDFLGVANAAVAADGGQAGGSEERILHQQRVGLSAVLHGDEVYIRHRSAVRAIGLLTGGHLRRCQFRFQLCLLRFPILLIAKPLQGLHPLFQSVYGALLPGQGDFGPLQVQAGEGGIVAQQLVALFHRLALGDIHLGYGLALRQVDFLQLVGGDGSAALGAVAPLVGGHKALHRVHVHRLAAGGAQHRQDAPHGADDRRGNHHTYNHFFQRLAHTSTPPERIPSRMVRVI